ncbi:MAG: methylenetetrahydrofolate reductase C-terminal domain-containing protein [Acidobacteriota bacterium]
MAQNNPIKDALAAGRFTYMVELVASAKTTEEKLAEIGAGLAGISGVIAGSVTSFAGGSAGHDPVTIAKIVKGQGLTPNVHLTCVSNPRDVAFQKLQEMHAADIHNVFCITGDHPQAGKLKKEDLAPLSGFDLDSVQMIELVAEMRAAGYPFHISCAVSPFKYTEADCFYQYLKLEKKIAMGADFAITQLGYDTQKFRELKRYLAEHGLKNFPVFGNVYLLSAPAAKKFAKGEPPGCWVSETLRDTVVAEAEGSTDKGMAARMERAAKMVAILRGLGYAGAYLGGDHDATRLRWVIERSEEIAGNWEEYAAEISYSPKGGYFLYGPPTPPKPVGFKVAMYDVLNSAVLAHNPGPRRTVLSAVMRWFDKTPERAQVLESAELSFKKGAFGCQACGNCVLGEMEYVCPMTCPKNLRNGPCGGPLNGMCEVTPEQPCIWVSVYDRAKARGHLEQLKEYIPPRNPELAGTSSYINFFLNRDSRPENRQPLVQINSGPKP